MIVEVRKLELRERKKAQYIRCLLGRGVIKKIVNKNGYVCFDTDEYDEYRAKAKRGRPILKKRGK